MRYTYIDTAAIAASGCCVSWCCGCPKSTLNLTTCGSRTGGAAVAGVQPGQAAAPSALRVSISALSNYVFKEAGCWLKVFAAALLNFCLILMRRHLSAMKFLQFKLTSAAIKLNVFNLQKYFHVARPERQATHPLSGRAKNPNLNLYWKLVWQQPPHGL